MQTETKHSVCVCMFIYLFIMFIYFPKEETKVCLQILS